MNPLNILFLFLFISILDYVQPQSVPTHINGTRRIFKPELEERALSKFRTMVGKYLYEDYMQSETYLLRWLRDQSLDLGRARDKLLNSLNWRKANGVDAVLKRDISDVTRHCNYDISAREKNGNPILTAALGQCYLRRIVLSGKLERLNFAVIYLLEQMSAISRQIEKKSNDTKTPIGWTIIADMGGLSYREHLCLNCLPFFISMMDIYLSHYPQVFKDIYIINANRITVTLVQTLRGVAPTNHEETLYAFGYDKKEWQTELLRRISPEQLTPTFGGTKSSKKLVN